MLTPKVLERVYQACYMGTCPPTWPYLCPFLDELIYSILTLALMLLPSVAHGRYMVELVLCCYIYNIDFYGKEKKT